MILPVILLCIAVIIMTAPSSWPMSPNTVAFVLAVIALVVLCFSVAGARIT